jgi:phospholipase/lecithinase/hemolysin
MLKKTLLVLALCAPQWVAAQVAFDRLVVFGTSLSDSGNAFVLNGAASTPPDYDLDPFLVPSAPYARGGHHFSNGATWIEQYARPRGLAASAHPSARDAGANATNYAVGGARARDDGASFNLSLQVRSFLAEHGGVAPGAALYVVEMGGNDIRDVLMTGRFQFLLEALASIEANLRILAGAGARHVLVWNVPNLGLTPALQAAGPEAVATAAFLTQIFNGNLQLIVEGYREQGLNIQLLDVDTKLGEIVRNPGAFGLTNVRSACVTPNKAPFQCTNPDEHLFWDGIHPTAAAHAIVAQHAAEVLGR